jgi:subtilase family serine protease
MRLRRVFRFLILPFLFSVSLFSVTLAQGQVLPRVVSKIDNTQKVTMTGNVHPLARAEFDRGPVADAFPMKRMLLLLNRSPEQQAALADVMEKQHDKSSPLYHQWFTPQEFGAQFGPADADVQAVTQWLASQGFAVEKVYGGKTVIEFSGTAGQVRAAFATDIRNYRVNEATFSANASDPQIPAALAPVVTGIVSLNNFPRKFYAVKRGSAKRVLGKNGLQPEFTFPNPFGGGTFYGVGPGDFATIYNSKGLIASGNDGTGQTIAIVGETNINVKDIVDFRSIFGLSANFSASNVILNEEDPGITSTDEETEADLDVQWSGAAAPGATVDFVVSASTPTTAGIDLSALYIIEHNLAGVMSESYGNCEQGLGSAGNSFYRTIWEQAAAQGITVIVSSGDGGSAGCDDFNSAKQATKGLAVSGLASTPFNVSLGGTDFDQINQWGNYWNSTNDSTTGTSAVRYIPEIPWNENCAQLGLTGCGASAPQGSLNIVAGSGGPSSQYTKPTWQLGVTGMPNDNHRDQPDVSLFASPGFTNSGYLICQFDAGNGECIQFSPGELGGLNIVGGTSASAPAFAGIMALVNQYQMANHGSSRQGNANYVLYGLAKKTGLSCASMAGEAAGCVFNDITHGNSFLPNNEIGAGTNSVPCQGGTLNCSSNSGAAVGVLVDPAHTSNEAWTVGTGYDMATGLGSVNVANLASNWGSVSTVATSTTLSLTLPANLAHGITESVPVNIAVTPASATGQVSLIANLQGPGGSTTQGLDQFTLGSGGKVGGTTHSLPGGTYTVIAHYAGDGTNAPSDSAPVSVTVAPESSQTFIVIPTFDTNGNQTSGNANSVTYGSNYLVRMYVTDANGKASASGPPSPLCATENQLTCPTGTVTLTNSAAAVGTGGGGPGIYNLNNLGYTRSISPNLSGGTYALKAVYGGDNSFQTSSSPVETFTVTPAATQTQMDSFPTRVQQGQTFQLEANVTPQLTGTVAYPGGTVTFYDGSTPLPGPVQITHGGNVEVFADIYNIGLTTPGPHIFTAQYNGDNNYSASTSTPVTTTLLITTTMKQTESSTNINYGQSITLTATMTCSNKGPAIRGQIFFQGNFPNFGNVVTTQGTDANGNQTLTATATTTPQGTQTIYAIYQGDANYAPSSSQVDVITVNIPDFSLTAANGINVVAVAGQAASGQIAITPLSQTPSTVTLVALATQMIPGYTLSVSPTQVSLNGSAVNATVSLTPNSGTTTNTLKGQLRHSGIGVVSQGDWRRLGVLTALAGLFLYGFPGRRRRLRAALGLGMVSLLFFVLGCGGGEVHRLGAVAAAAG